MSASDSQLVVVTGGAGFIGSHTVGQLLDQGHRVVVLDNFSTGRRANLADWSDHPNLRVVATNIVDGLWPALTPVVNEMGPVDRIIHLAAQTAVITSIENPLHDVRLNYGATVHVLEYARYNKVKKVVFASSAAVYGDIDALPVHEELRCVPVSPYGIDKLGG
ncbi:MAG: GDP-mannose 4,6-dehydratase, partial [Myxococcota bacterium]